MPRWTREPDADQRIELEIASFNIGLYKSREDTAKSHGVDPNTLRRRLNGKHKSQCRAYSPAATTTSCRICSRATVYIPCKALETVSRIVTKKTAEAREKFRKAEVQGFNSSCKKGR